MACELMRHKLTVRGRYAVYLGPPAGTRSKNFTLIKAPIAVGVFLCTLRITKFQSASTSS